MTDRGFITLFLCGDVMTGRGIDQILPHPGDPWLQEPAVHSARDYVALAERAHGPIPRPAPFDYIWGDALKELASRRPDVRIANLETSVTTNDAAAHKAINYRMNPRNVACLSAAGIDCCVLANNHVLDWGAAGLVDTLVSLQGAGIRVAGAGRDDGEANRPAILELAGRGRVLVFAYGAPSSGVPRGWAAGLDEPGIAFLDGVTRSNARRIGSAVRAAKRPGDIAVVSLHWGGNWGYQIPDGERAFAHLLIDSASVDVVYGHSSHHAKAIEIYRDKPILYGCGDFITDYEGIEGYEHFRDDLVLMYFLSVFPGDGRVRSLEMVPLQIRNFRLRHASGPDAVWLRDMFTREGKRFGTEVLLRPDGTLALRWH